MQIVRNAKIVSATLDEEVDFGDGNPPLNKFLVDLEVDGDTKGELVWWVPKGGNAKPPLEGETGDFELEEKKYGLKIKRHRAQGGGNFRGAGGGGGGGGTYRPTAPEDAKRMSRSTALQAAVAAAGQHSEPLTSDQIIAVAGKFAAFIYGEPV